MKSVVRGWLAAVYRNRSRAARAAGNYHDALAAYPAMFADLARFCCQFDTTHVPGDPQAICINEGKRIVWMHIQAMAGVDKRDLPKLRERTEFDE